MLRVPKRLPFLTMLLVSVVLSHSVSGQDTETDATLAPPLPMSTRLTPNLTMNITYFVMVAEK